jgi:hypothetical protein
MSYPQLRALREAAQLDLDNLALAMQIDPESMERCEASADEALDTLELQQWAAWAAQLGLPLIEMLAQAGLAEPGSVKALTFRELRDAVGDLAGREGSLHRVEERSGWELEAFIRDPEDGWTRKLGFFQSVAQTVGRDWRGIAAAYPAPL